MSQLKGNAFAWGGGRGLFNCAWTHGGFLNTTEDGACRGNDNKGGGGEISTAWESPDVSLKWSPAKLICSMSPTGFSEYEKAVFLRFSLQRDNALLELQILPGAFNFRLLPKGFNQGLPFHPIAHVNIFLFK